jgi:DNA-binding NtrC family response regulator
MAQIITFPHKDKVRHAVLIVEPETAIRELLCDALNEAGFNALAVSSADEAARMLDRGIFVIDLVFSDADVPGILNGHALANWVVEHKPNIPVLLATHERDADWAETVLKPYDLPLVIRRIRATLARRVKRRA